MARKSRMKGRSRSQKHVGSCLGKGSKACEGKKGKAFNKCQSKFDNRCM